MTNKNPKIGFIGLGEMGKWMALNLQKAGHPLTVFDINPEPLGELKKSGAYVAESLVEVAERSDWVLLSLPDAKVVEEAIFGEKGLAGGLSRGDLVVDMGTTDYLATLHMAEKLTASDVELVDAPVSGMEARAKTGELTIMFGGPETVFDWLTPIFNIMGNNVIHMGDVGSGQLTKLVNQLLFNISCAAIAEVLPMSAKLGLDPEKVIDVVTTGTGRSFAAEFFGPLALEGIFDQGYPLDHAYKDMISAAEISAHRKIPLPVTKAAMTTYQTALADGFGQLGKGAMIKVFERLTGVEFRRKNEE